MLVLSVKPVQRLRRPKDARAVAVEPSGAIRRQQAIALRVDLRGLRQDVRRTDDGANGRFDDWPVGTTAMITATGIDMMAAR